MTSQRIYLVGLPGSGKTTLGQALAKRLKLEFIDLDKAIEEASGRSVPDIFSLQGENSFRIMERESLRSISTLKERFIMATGGGTPCFYANMDYMNGRGTTVYLDVGLEELASRLMKEGLDQRPLFRGRDQPGLVREIRRLKAEREGFYTEAAVKIRDDQPDTATIISSLPLTF